MGDGIRHLQLGLSLRHLTPGARWHGLTWFNFWRQKKINCFYFAVYRELWINVPGSSVTDLESSSLYPCAPSKTQFIDTFCVYNPDSGDYYGQRLRSFFRAPETGNYTFQTSCDNACQLWMSNSKLPTGKRLIIDQRRYNKRYLWDKYVSIRLDTS